MSDANAFQGDRAFRQLGSSKLSRGMEMAGQIIAVLSVVAVLGLILGTGIGSFTA